MCLMLARNLGLPAAQSKVRRFKDEVAIVVERYDRQQNGNDIIRVHQEDTCQALGIMPTKKYQNEGGPSAADIIELLRTYSTDRDRQKFAREVRTHVDKLVEVLISMAKQLPDEVSAAHALAREEALNSALIDRLAKQLIDRAHECQRLLGDA